MLDQVSHPYKTTGKTAFPCILIFIFLDSKFEDKIFCNECYWSVLKIKFFVTALSLRSFPNCDPLHFQIYAQITGDVLRH